ncbi:hypothetical protein WICANDRAFT_98093 [Wickerhamomyces anomalus NRRL Y-366-8]|uniref:Core Histone H2A/H2B/H3 domain-containing protein n=1 Tax=Wickerhamomyces anomalus (strain ATCC 58044 / CBS 1984 / NCYC 433 / NRRL Y-366-8) TaxID=683960 RepID=A0A1E3NUU6_WICAA|nr:uncharacterized protein WICANDRAFT_98093 [Wickerhamomyces anomalus NRRL Y-366-8]ODQ56810.1 hypothetical protein WICANDRAFT_98093 [Wickerhamomyces anomalus NRRL Y-366-8]
MNDQYNRFEQNYLEDQEPGIILEQEQKTENERPIPTRSDSYIQNYEYEQQQQQQQQESNHTQPPHPEQQQQQQKHQESEQQPQSEQQQPTDEAVEDEDDANNEDLMGDSVFSNVGQGLTGNYRNMMMAYWQETINSIEHEEHDFKNHQLPLARIKKVMKTDEEVRMISAEAPILFAKGCDIFITELTMRAWIHAEENKRRTLQRSDIAAALQKSDMFDFLIDIVPREEVLGSTGGGNGSNGSTKKNSSRQNSTTGYGSNDLQQQLLQQQLLQQQFLKQQQQQQPAQNDEGNNEEPYQYNDMNVYENRY